MKKVILWGFNDFTKAYIPLIKEAGMAVAFIVSDMATRSYDGIRILSKDEYKNTMSKEYTGDIILMENIYEANDGFLKSLEGLLCFLPNLQSRVLHPSFVAEYLKLDLTGKVMIVGCNRSGSTVLFHIVKNLMDQANGEISNKTTMMVEGLARDYFDNLIRYLNSILKNENRCLSISGSTSFGTINYFDAKKDEFVYVSPFQCNRFLFDRIHRTYSTLDQSLINYAAESKYKLFFPIRNPLDIIVSNAFEIQNLFMHMYPNIINDETDSEFKMDYGLSFLSNMDWFANMAKLVKSYFDAYLLFQNQISAFKYEDLIENPNQTIRTIANELKVEVDDESIGKLWDKIGFKPLTKYRAHMFRPGQGKWMEFFTSQHLEILKSMGYPQLTKALGYEIDYNQNLNVNSKLYERLSKTEFLNKVLAIRDIILNLEFAKPVNFVHDEIKEVDVNSQQSTLRFVSNSLEFKKLFKRASATELFKQVIDMGSAHRPIEAWPSHDRIDVKDNSIAIVGVSDAIAGQIDSWIEEAQGYSVSCFINPADVPLTMDSSFRGKPLIHSGQWPTILKNMGIKQVLITTEDNHERHQHIHQAKEAGLNLVNAIHPTVVIMDEVIMQDNIILFPKTFIGYRTELSTGVIVTSAHLDHHNVIKECATIDPGAVFAGNVTIGAFSKVHTGAIIKNRINVGQDAVLGAGTVIIKDVPDKVTVAGVPGEIIKRS